MGFVDKLLRGAGFAPAGASILVSFFKPEIMEKVDILKGFGGSGVHYLALGFALMGYLIVQKYYKSRRPGAPLRRWRFYLICLAGGLFVLTVVFAKVTIPESYTALADIRWQAALLVYWAFYLLLGASCA